MAFVFANSPHQRGDNHLLGHDDDDATVHSSSHPSSSAPTPEQDMGRDKDRPRLEIILDKEVIYLKGTGVDVEPARLSGNVALYLAESSSIKEITLQFRGKARLPATTHDPITSTGLTYVVCNHEWSFLEGEKKHSHTLKAGRHFFPFQLQLGGSLPSSVFTNASGGASVAYKLRAHAVRPGLNHNLQAVLPVSIIRSFTSEALEYQQTLEIENTWPEKLMYSIMVPHKAWAAGDTLTALVKFSPLAKGVGVLNVNTSIHETTKVFARQGYQEATRVVASARHEIVGGKAVEAPEHDHRPRITHTPGHSAPGSPLPTPRRAPTSGSYFSLSPYPAPTSSVTSPVPASQPGPSSISVVSQEPEPVEDDGLEMSQNDVVTYLTLHIPMTVTPSHALDPIIVTHRIRWSILILNADGHTSELRCSLPLHLLDYHLLDEARSYTSATRRLLIGGPDVPPAEEEDMELPSYNAHVRDRVANMFLPESATMRVTNPWVTSGVSPTLQRTIHESSSPWPLSESGISSPLEAHSLSHLPHVPRSGESTPLDWVNSELLLSLTDDTPAQLSMSSRASPDHSNDDSASSSRPGSGSTSVHASRRSSRSSSPERAAAAVSPKLHVGGANETYVHAHSHASRNLHNLYKSTMKPFSSLTHPQWLSSRSSSHSHLSTLASQDQHRHQQQHQQREQQLSNARHMQFTDPNSGTALLHRAFTDVPDYGVASRGFIGGVPPLSSMRGLPSYEEAEESVHNAAPRTRSESDIAGRFPIAPAPLGAPHGAQPQRQRATFQTGTP